MNFPESTGRTGTKPKTEQQPGGASPLFGELKMTELEQKIINVLSDRDLTMQEIADAVGCPAAEVYHGGLFRLVGAGHIEKIRSEKITLYRIPRAYASGARSEHNNISLSMKDCVQGNTCVQKKKDPALNNTRTPDAGEAAKYPETEEEVISEAGKIGYMMSVHEAAMFLAAYAAVGWINKFGQKIHPKSWKFILRAWKHQQTPEQKAAARKEARRRSEGLPPIDPEEKNYEYYEDAQGRKWRKPVGTSDWEEVFEEITFSDGTKAIKGVV